MGPLEGKTPLDGGKVEFNFMFLLCVCVCVCVFWGGNGKSICCRHMNMQQNSGCDFIIFMRIKVNILILFTVGEEALQS